MRVTERVQNLQDLLSYLKPSDRRDYCITFPQVAGVPCDLDCNKLEVDVSLLNSVLPKIVRGYPIPPIYIYEYWNPKTQEHRGIFLNEQHLLYNLFAFLQNEISVDFGIPMEEFVTPAWEVIGRYSEVPPQLRRRLTQATTPTYSLYETSDTDNIDHLYNRFQAVKI